MEFGAVQRRGDPSTSVAHDLLSMAQGEWAIDRLSIEERIFLISLIEASQSKHPRILGSLSVFQSRLADIDTAATLITFLHQRHTIAVDPNSPSLRIVNGQLMYDPWQAVWMVPRAKERSTLYALAAELSDTVDPTDVRGSAMLMAVYRNLSFARCFSLLRSTALRYLQVELTSTLEVQEAIQCVLSLYRVEWACCILSIALKNADWKRMSRRGPIEVRLVEEIQITLTKARSGKLNLTPFMDQTPRETLWQTLAHFVGQH
jgi:hypothetical protein